jgi:hypothetical protein
MLEFGVQLSNYQLLKNEFVSRSYFVGCLFSPLVVTLVSCLPSR